jgi:argininosuccinate lyase
MNMQRYLLEEEFESLLAQRRALEAQEAEFTSEVEDRYEAIERRLEEVNGLLDAIAQGETL